MSNPPHFKFVLGETNLGARCSRALPRQRCTPLSLTHPFVLLRASGRPAPWRAEAVSHELNTAFTSLGDAEGAAAWTRRMMLPAFTASEVDGYLPKIQARSQKA